MRQPILPLVFSIFLLSFVPVSQAKGHDGDQALLFEGGLGINACFGEVCDEGGPWVGVDLAAMYRMHRHFGVGINFHYGRFEPEKLDTQYYYVLNFEGRGILPIGSRMNLFAGVNFGYVTTYSDGFFESEDKFLIFRATGPTFGAGAGVSFRVTERLHLGVHGRVWFPIWSDACFYEADGGECREPQDLDIKFDMKPWFAGLFLQYELPY